MHKSIEIYISDQRFKNNGLKNFFQKRIVLHWKMKRDFQTLNCIFTQTKQEYIIQLSSEGNKEKRI